MSGPRIGFIGLGLMGRAMVSRLQDKGYALSVLGNRDPAAWTPQFHAAPAKPRQPAIWPQHRTL